jgi:hypothetical protein
MRSGPVSVIPAKAGIQEMQEHKILCSYGCDTPRLSGIPLKRGINA